MTKTTPTLEHGLGDHDTAYRYARSITRHGDGGDLDRTLAAAYLDMCEQNRLACKKIAELREQLEEAHSVHPQPEICSVCRYLGRTKPQ